VQAGSDVEAGNYPEISLELPMTEPPTITGTIHNAHSRVLMLVLESFCICIIFNYNFCVCW
jgi:hypothetical protein